MNRFPFIVLEGTDGCGKTTFRKMLFATLAKRTIPLSLGPHSWLDVRACEVLTRHKYHGLAYAPSEIMSATVQDMQRLTNDIILPHLAYRPVICDRWIASAIVYADVLDSIEMDGFRSAFATNAVARPDICIYVDTDPEVAQVRLRARSGGDAEGLQPWDSLVTQQRLHTGFQRFWSTNGGMATMLLRVENNSDLETSTAHFEANVIPECLKMLSC